MAEKLLLFLCFRLLDSSGTTVYNYNVRGLLLSETKGDVTKSYTYDANGNRTSFVAPSINVDTSYTYDSLGRMLTVSDEAFGTTSYTYDANSNVTRVANGTTTATMSYDAQNRLVSKFSGADTYTLTYYNDGNVKRVTDSGGTINYTYNETGALASGDGATYKYDFYGNRSEMTKDGSTYRYYYDKNNRLIREADFAGNIASAYKYDNNGNLIERTHMPETAEPTETLSESLTVVGAPTFTTDTFTFDVLGRMSSANVNGTTTTYTYDGNGLRQTKNNKAFVYDGANIVWEGETPTAGTTYYRGLELIAYKTPETTRTFYYSDWHGNIEGYDYDDFGNPTGGNTANPFRYNGEYFDEETGFIYLRARYYDPSMGRFVSEDPIRDGLNWYAYCAGNPIRYTDPSGLIITLVGTEDEMLRSFEQLQALTNDELTYDKETGVVMIVSSGTMNTDKTLTAGTKMVSDLIANDDFNTKIERINAENDGCYVWYEDGGATVQMNDWSEAGGNWFYEVSDGAGGTTYDDHKDVAHIILGHELIHATHHMNGTLADYSRTVYRYTSTGLVADIRGNLNMSEEYNTVGLYHIVEYKANGDGIVIRRFYIPWPGSLTENTLRAEQGLTNRTAY